jgi:predicted outer membrane repeat protein
MKFAENTAGIENDIHLAGQADIVFESARGGRIDFSDGLRTSGSGRLYKWGGGELVFGGERTEINNSFSIEDGTAVFASINSKVAALELTPYKTMLDMRDRPIGQTGFGHGDYLLIESALTLNNVWLGLDFDFVSSTNDFIFISGDLNITRSSLTINVNTFGMAGASQPFMKAAGTVSGWQNLFLTNQTSSYRIEFDAVENVFSLAYYGATLWDVFVDDYQDIGLAAGQTITLPNNVYAYENAPAIAAPTGDHFIIEGHGFNVNARNFEDLGFELNGKNVVFSNVGLSSFTRTATSFGGRGGAANIQNSTITFIGTAAFSQNRAEISGGALFIKESSVAFIGGYNGGGALKFFDNEAAGVQNDIYLEDSKIAFGGSIEILSGIRSQNSALLYQKGNFVLDGINHFSGMSRFEFANVFMNALGSWTYRNNAAAMILSQSTAVFAGETSFIANAGLAISADRSSIIFISNSISQNGAPIYPFIFGANNGGGVDISLSASSLLMMGNVKMDGGINANNSAISHLDGIWTLSGKNEISAGSATLNNSLFYFESGELSYRTSLNAFTISNSTAFFKMTSATFMNNASGAMAIVNSTIVFAPTLAAPSNPQAWSDYALIFRGNTNGGLKNDMRLENSLVSMSGALWMEGGISASETAIFYDGGIWHLSGLNEFRGMRAFNFREAFFEVGGGTFAFVESAAGMKFDRETTAIFNGSSASFVGNSARAIYVTDTSSLTLSAPNRQGSGFPPQPPRIESEFGFIFKDNAAGDIHLSNNSELWMSGGIWMEGGIEALGQSQLGFSNGVWHLGGVNSFSDMRRFEINRALVLADGGIWEYQMSHRLNVSNSTVGFIGTSMTFSGNTDNALRVSNSSLTFIAYQRADGGFGIVFKDNGLEDIRLTNSALHMGGNIWMGKGLTASGGSFVHRDGKLFIDGEKTFSALSKFELNNSNALFAAGGTFSYQNAVSPLRIANSTVTFKSSALLMGNDGVGLSAVNSSITFAGLYSRFEENAGGFDLDLENSSLWMRGAVNMQSGLNAIGGAIHFSSGSWSLRAANEFENMSAFEIKDAAISGANISFNYLNGAEITLRNSSWTISGNSNLNFGNSGDYDVRLIDSKINIEAGAAEEIVFTNGFKSAGGEIIKRGWGNVKFNGIETILRGSFNLDEGAAHFNSNITTINVLTMAPNTIMDLRNDSGNTMFIGEINLNGARLGLDFDFSNAGQGFANMDFINVELLNIGIDGFTLIPRVINGASQTGDKLKFAEGDIRKDERAFMRVLNVPEYKITLYQGALYFVYRGANLWDKFVIDEYWAADERGQANLDYEMFGSEITAYLGAEAFGGLGADNVTINGDGGIINSTGIANLGFTLRERRLNVNNVEFTSFSRIDDEARFADSGAVMHLNNSIVNFDGHMRFTNNFAKGSGGALYLTSSTVNFYGHADFYGNRASSGGAVYLQNSIMSFYGNDSRPTLNFSDNFAGGRANDFYLSRNSLLIFDVLGNVDDRGIRKITLPKGLRADGDGKIIKRGGGELRFEEASSAQINTSFDIEDGKIVLLSSANFIKSLNVKKGGALALTLNNHPFTFNSLKTSFISIEGALEIDADFSDLQAKSDVIFSSNTSISGGASVSVSPKNRRDWKYGSIADIILTNGGVNYGGFSFDTSLYKVYYRPDNKAITIMFVGTESGGWNKRALTHNQKEAALFLNHAANNYYGGGSFDADSMNESYRFDMTIREISLMNDAIDVRRALDEISGSFLAQTIVAMADKDMSARLYQKTKPIEIERSPDEIAQKKSVSNSLWAEGALNDYRIDSNDNEMGRFKGSKYDGAIGFSFIEKPQFSLGTFLSLGAENIKQAGNKASAFNMEVGAYGGYFVKTIENRFFMNFGRHSVRTSRYIDLDGGLNPTADFELWSMKMGAESSIPIYEINPGVKTRLYGGARGAVIMNDEIKETADAMQIKVEPGAYKRLTIYAGLRFMKDGWHISGELGSILAGNNEQSQFRMRIDGFDNDMDIRGSNRDSEYLALGGGYEREIYSGISVYGLANLMKSKDGYEQNLGASLGVKIMLPVSSAAKDYLSNDQKQRERASLERQRKAQEQAERARLENERRRAESERLRAEKEARDKKTAQSAARRELLDSSREEDPSANNYSYDDPADDLKAPLNEGDIYVYALTDNGSKVSWRLFKDFAPSDFNEDGIELPDRTKKSIADSLNQYRRNDDNIVRVRILGYGETGDAAALALSKARAEEIYKEINKQRTDSIAPAKTAGEKLEENLQEARIRRAAAIGAYKLKAASFKSGSDILSVDARKNIEPMAKDMIIKDYKRITIEGHTDSTGSDDSNISLSNRRALAVYIELLRNGVPQDRMQTMGLGSKMPAATNSTEAGKANNRRVEIFME